MAKVNCMKCRHYMATYDPQRPRGCRVYNLKSQSFPNLLVRQQTGQDCLSFEPRKTAKAQDKLSNLNRDDLW